MRRCPCCVRRGRPAVAGLLVALLAPGCASFDPARARREQTGEFVARLDGLAAEELARPLALDDCIRIAVARNYDVLKADLDLALARIGRNVAFTAFLPGVTASAGYQVFDRDPLTTEQRFGTAGVEAGLPVFLPSAWFLYAAARHGYASAGIAANHVRQSIALQTTARYYDLLVQQDTVAALETQAAAARETAARAHGLAAEGLIAAWEGDQALQLAEARETERDRARRHLVVLRAELLQTMGLPPLAPVEIAGAPPEPRRPEGALEDLVLRALEVHPRLAIADREVVIREHRVRQAFCAFLPTVSLFASGAWTGNDLAAHASSWVAGFRGVWTLFDGFANRARYRAARVERRRSDLARESAFLSVIVQVVAAEAAVRDAADATRLGRRAYEVAAARFADRDARAREGLLPLADALDARAAMDLAEVEWIRRRYRERVALAHLELAMGLTPLPAADSVATEGK